MRRLRLFMVAAAGVALTSCAGPTPGGSRQAGPRTEILWDSYGVPHIFASDRRGLGYAFGWAQMQNHGDLLLRLVAQARGRAAELLGESYLNEDRWVWKMGIPARAQAHLAMQSPGMGNHLAGFVAGINAFASAHPEMIGDSVRAVLPVSEVDIVAHAQRLLTAFLAARETVDDDTRLWRERGSNAWAVAPARTASGHTLLLQNPHLPWRDLFTWTEAQMVMGGVNLYGAALIGSPVFMIAFNDHLGWSHTVNTQDGTDLYELTLVGDGYRWNGGVRAFETETRVLIVRRGDGRLRADTLRIRRSVHGPVVAEKPGKVIALRAVGGDLATSMEQWWAMGRARNLAEFERAIRPNQISGQNITYADRAGHIMMFYGGNTPVRSRGDRAYWLGIVPGDSSTTLWTQLHSYSEMPKTLDPPSGWVQNANEPPWWATFPPVVRRSDYPAYLASRGMTLRAQRSTKLLDSDSSITYDELVSYKHSTRMELADRILDDLLPVARSNGNARARAAADVLENWDRSADAESRGAVLFTEWWDELGRRTPSGRSPWRIPWSEAAPRSTPAGLGDTARAVRALETAANKIKTVYGAMDVRWGDVYRLQRDALDLPANGASGTYGVFRVVGYEEGSDHRSHAVAGDSWVAAVEFSDPVRARSLVGYGNASRRGSPHRTDQLELFSRKQLKPVWRMRSEIEAHLEKREVF